ncbi:MAG: large conductance mechanosensitive channel protein MscL [Cellulomonadaceae bacterium]
MKDVFSGFKDFIMRGNVVELAVAVIIGGAFGQIVTAVVDGLITPLIALLFRAPDLSSVSFTLGSTHFLIGSVLNAVINFLLIAAAVYFVIVMPLNKLAGLRKKGEEPEPEKPSEDIILLQEIRDLLSRGTGVSTPNTTPGTGSSTPQS